MANIVPSDITRLALSGKQSSEIETLKLLKSSLSKDYTVFHGVHWCREYEAWSHFGEIDFVVLNKSGDVLFIEQKNGELNETHEGLLKRYGSDEKNVAQQLHRSIDKVREKFKWTHGRNRHIEVDYIFYCPDYKIKQVNAAGLNKERIVDAVAKDGLSQRIEKVLGAGKRIDDGWYEKVEDFFYQTFDLVPDIHAHIGSQEKQFVRQSGALANILANLEMDPYRLKLLGTAGSGKSLFARRFLDREVSAKRKVLLVCYNRPLADHLKVNISGNGLVNTFYGFCDDFLQSRGIKLDFSVMSSDPGFWHKVLELVVAEDIQDENKFDTLIVDEGQDFEDEWFEILQLFLRDNANILWLEDADQNLFEKPPVSLNGFVCYRSIKNYRTPESIAIFIKKTLPVSFEQENDLPGLGVRVHSYKDGMEQTKIVGEIVRDLTRSGFSHEDIVIISCKGIQGSVFSKYQTIAGIPLIQFTGEYDKYGKQIMTDGKLYFDSVYRYKGQESPAVILVDVDPKEKEPGRAERVIYCGMTRATVRLEMVVNKENESNKRFLRKGI